MALALHLILSAYGFWLPNDPRGSWSHVVREPHLQPFGPATKVTTTRSVAHARHDAGVRRVAQETLRHPPVHFTGVQARAVARGFQVAAGEATYRVLALAVLPDHAHLVIAQHPHPPARLAAHLKAKAAMRLHEEDCHPLKPHAAPSGRAPSPFARGYWCVFLDHDADVVRTIQYVNDNPVRAGLPRQHWRWLADWR
jgi:REP element-mobilizing transposase RayT